MKNACGLNCDLCGALECIRMDNGPELIASAIRDRCRLSGSGTI